MHAIIQSSSRLSDADIIQNLRHLRQHALVESSHFIVSAILEIQQSENTFYYVGGVNVENSEHNRLSLHAEQNALSTAHSFLGSNAQFSKVWVMGASDDATVGDDTASANTHVQVCGHCRQILLSFAAANAEVFTVTLNGDIGVANKLEDLLAKAFYEKQMNVSSQFISQHSLAPSENYTPLALAQQQKQLSPAEVYQYLRAIPSSPINFQHQTSPIISCILELKHHRYVPGRLMQDAAFLTTDALFSAFGTAITLYGLKGLALQAIHFYSNTFDPAQLSGGEIKMLSRFANHDIPLYFYLQNGEHKSLMLSDCIKHQASSLLVGLMQQSIPS